MRLIFIGIHGKPNLKPLDSSTKSGKIIDRVIAKLEGYEVHKTNLFPRAYMPDDAEIEQQGLFGYIISKYNPYSKNDILVLLGARVKKYFPFSDVHEPSFIEAVHPSKVMSKEATELYIQDIVDRVKYLTD